MKVVINDCYGGFDLSERAIMRYAEIKGIKLYKNYIEYGIAYTTQPAKTNKEIDQFFWSVHRIHRDDPALVQVVEELGRSANTQVSFLKVIDIPEGIEWDLEEHAGNEWIAEAHRTWR